MTWTRGISRRTLLRGAGVGLGLPWLEAMGAVTAAAPVRMAVLYMANGVNTKMWTPEGTGSDFRLSPTLAPLEDLKDRVTVVSNLWNAAANTGDGHYVKESSILTCTTISKTLGVDLNIHGTSMDQVAAQRVGERTPIPSLELGIELKPLASIQTWAIRGFTVVTSPGAIRPRRSHGRSAEIGV